MKRFIGSLLFIGLTGCSTHHLPKATILVGDNKVQVEIAASPEQRETGLMHRTTLEPDSGMLFVYPDTAIRSFWMKSTPLPLSIAYINADGMIVRIRHMTPHSTQKTSSMLPAKYALEMNKGWFEAHEVKVGSVITQLPDSSLLTGS